MSFVWEFGRVTKPFVLPMHLLSSYMGKSHLSLGLANAPTNWDEILQWLHNASPIRSKKLAFLLSWKAIIYEAWKEKKQALS